MKPITRRHLTRAIATMSIAQLRTHLVVLEYRRDVSDPSDGEQTHSWQIARVRAALAALGA